MRVAEIRLLYDYNYWAHERILRQVARLTPERFLADAGLSWGGVAGTLAHVLGTEGVWRSRWQGASGGALVRSELATAAALATAWEENRAEMRAFLATLGDDDLDRVVAYVRQGRDHAHPLWTQMVHVVNHGTQHRSEVAVLLTEAGHSPGDIDLSLFMRERGGG